MVVSRFSRGRMLVLNQCMQGSLSIVFLGVQRVRGASSERSDAMLR